MSNELESDIAMAMNFESLAIKVSDVDWKRLAACHPRAPTVAYSQVHLRSTPSAISAWA